MRVIVEELGQALLAIIATGGVLAMVFKAMEPGGVLYTVVLNYMNSICG